LALLAAAGKITGDIRISGHQKDQQSFARISGYVEQFDIVTPFPFLGFKLDSECTPEDGQMLV